VRSPDLSGIEAPVLLIHGRLRQHDAVRGIGHDPQPHRRFRFLAEMNLPGFMYADMA
jgi:hypothetical protein